MNSAETAQILRILQASYPHVEITEDLAELWANVFHSQDVAVVAAAARRWIEHERFWPTPADISAGIRHVKNSMHSSDSPDHIRSVPPSAIVSSGPRARELMFAGFREQLRSDGERDEAAITRRWNEVAPKWAVLS